MRKILFPLCLAMGLPTLAQAELRISPQFVVERILGQSRDARELDLERQSAYTAFYNNFGAYDLRLGGEVSYEDSRLAQLSGGGNLRDKNTVWNLTMAKRLPTGTDIAIGYERTQQDSVFRSASSRSPYVVYDVGTVTVTQDLLGNFFGIAERRTNHAARRLVEAAELLHKEEQEGLALNSLRLFWDTYVARGSLREAQAQKDKYEALLKEVQRKSRVSFVSPGDLPKARAEFAAQERNVKAATFQYSKNLEALLTAMRMQEADRKVTLVLKEEIPALPTMVMPPVDSLRLSTIRSREAESSQLALRAATLASDWPELKLVGEADFSALETTSGRAFSGVRRGGGPEYSVALQLNYRLFSDQYKASRNAAGVAYELAANAFERAKEDLRRDVGTAMEQVRFTYAAAQSAIEEMKQWEAAVKAQERSYNQGRLDFSQLIQDYNSYYRSRSTRIRAIGDYQIALQNYLATVDELVK
jgi:outer membrane protein TolC